MLVHDSRLVGAQSPYIFTEERKGKGKGHPAKGRGGSRGSG